MWKTWKMRAFGLVAVAVVLTGGSALAASSKNFGAHLKGHDERPVPRETHAQGQATFQVSDARAAIQYKLNVANIENVTQAHIHLGPSDQAGPIVVWLYPVDGPPAAAPAGGRTQGPLAEGTITAGDLIGPLTGQ